MSANTNYQFAAAHTDSIRWHEFHRWLNPFRVEQAVVHTQLSAHGVEDALRLHLYEIPWRQVTTALEARPVGEIALRDRSRGLRWLHIRMVPSAAGTDLVIALARSKLEITFLVFCLVYVPWTVFSGISGLYDLTSSPSTSLGFGGPLWNVFILAFVGVFGLRLLQERWRRGSDMDYYREFLTSVVGENVAGSDVTSMLFDTSND